VADPVQAFARPSRKGARKAPPSVIEATATAPMPVVDTPALPELPTAHAPALAAATPIPPQTPSAPVPFADAPPAADPAELATEDTVMDTIDATETTANATADRAQAMFADLSDRADGAMERGTKLVEEMSAFGKGNMEALVESSRIAARGFESLGQDAATFAKQSFEQSAAALRQLATVKSPTEFMKLQGDLIRQSFDQVVAQGSRQTETVLKLAGEVAQPLSNRVAVAMQKVKVAA